MCGLVDNFDDGAYAITVQECDGPNEDKEGLSGLWKVP